MILTNVVQDDTMGVPGFEHQTFTCSECHDLERRFVFTKQDRGRDGEPMPEQAAPTVAPASTVHEEHVAVIDPAENVLVEPTQIAPSWQCRSKQSGRRPALARA
jgi:cytochrome c peroxidase